MPEILEFYKFFFFFTIAPLVVYNTNSVQYAQWALNENLITDGQNHFDVIDIQILNTCVSKDKLRQSILTYDKFKDLIMRRIINDQDRFVFFCLFEGIKGKDYQDIINMEFSDIDEVEKTVLIKDKKIKVPQGFINIARDADKQEDYETLTGNHMKIDLLPGDKIYKLKYNSTQGDASRAIYNTILRNIKSLKQLSESVSAKSITESGMIHYLNLRAKELNQSVEYLLFHPITCQDIISKYHFNIGTRKRWLLQYDEFVK